MHSDNIVMRLKSDVEKKNKTAKHSKIDRKNRIKASFRSSVRKLDVILFVF